MMSPNPQQFRVLLRRASPMDESPEKRLVIAILSQAVSDAMTTGRYALADRRHARMFFLEGSYRPFCELVDLDPNWVGKVLRDYAGIECGTSWGRAA